MNVCYVMRWIEHNCIQLLQYRQSRKCSFCKECDSVGVEVPRVKGDLYVMSERVHANNKA